MIYLGQLLVKNLTDPQARSLPAGVWEKKQLT